MRYLSAFFLAALLASCALRETQAQGFAALFQKKMGQLTDKIFSWNPFSPKPPVAARKQDDYDDAASVELFDTSGNETVVRKHYFYGCECKGYNCSCCAHVEVPKTKLNHTGCLNMTYHSMDDIELTLDLNQKVYYNSSISIVNPPDLCVGVPFDLAKLCIKFYRLDARNRSLSGCADLIVKLDGIELRRIKLGSFRFGNGSSFYEKNLMKIYLNRKRPAATAVTAEANRTNSTLDQFYESYESFINKLHYFPLPKFSFNFQPDRLINNFYESLFKDSRIIRRKGKNETARSEEQPRLESNGGNSAEERDLPKLR